MIVSLKSWLDFIQKLGALDDKAAKLIVDYMSEHSVLDDDDKRAFLDYAYAVATKYGEASSSLACDLYDMMAEAQNAHVPPAVPAPTPTYSEVARTVNGASMHSQNPEYIGGSVGTLVKRTGVDTTLNNALRDGAEWAWIPHGDTCPFCLMLASNGWQRASKKALRNGHANHIHANCDCTYAIRFDGESTIEGYDPEALYEQYKNAEGRSGTDKINYLRRKKYAANKDVINAQKRAAYALRNTYPMKRNAETVWKGTPTQHSKEEIDMLRQFASEKGIVLDSSFTSFDGDISLAQEFIETVNDSIEDRAFARKTKKIRISVSYSMADDAYAEAQGSNIIINGFAYRDRGLLEKDYMERVKTHYFTHGSTYKDIATHESAHVIVYLHQLKTRGSYVAAFGKGKETASELIYDVVSEYALKNEKEFIAEAFVCYKNGNRNNYILKALKYCGMV